MSTVAAATTSKSSQSTTSKSEMVTMPTDPKVNAVATSEMVTMPTDNAKEVGPRKPVFHPGLGVEGVILPPPITSGSKQSAISAAEVSVGAGTCRRHTPAPPQQRWFQPLSRLAEEETAVPGGTCSKRKSPEKEPGPPPVCKDVGWYQGTVKVIACDDSRSAELYRAAVANVGEVYPGAKLAAVNWEEVPVRPRARMWIPSAIKEPEKLLTMLQRCNPNLPTQDWRVAKIEEMPGPTNQAVIILNKVSLAPIDPACSG
ncbi:hypothetical protein ACLKA7_000801 [Drosophila subpalustris]